MNLFTYEKGYCFVYYLSQLCGDPQRFDDFLRVSSPLPGQALPSTHPEPLPSSRGCFLSWRVAWSQGGPDGSGAGHHLLPLAPPGLGHSARSTWPHGCLCAHPCVGGGWCAQPAAFLSPAPPAQAYVEKYKFTSVVAQDLLDSFLSFFPELKEQCVDCRAGEATAGHMSASG